MYEHRDELRHRLILVIEDDASVAEALQLVLRDFARVTVRETVKGGIEALKLMHVDLVILDMHLPDGSGLRILGETGAIPVIVVTGNPTVENAIAAANAGVVRFLRKPFSWDDLRYAVSLALGGPPTEIRRILQRWLGLSLFLVLLSALPGGARVIEFL